MGKEHERVVRQRSPTISDGPVTISALARRFDLARSTLLHYDKLGLLKPTGKTAAGYRLYGADAAARLARIVELRAAGMGLEEIGKVLASRVPLADALLRQMRMLQHQRAATEDQLRTASTLLRGATARATQRKHATAFTRETWSAMFRAIGLDDAAMRRWHRQFEETNPEDHKAFLQSLGLDAAEVKRVRRWSLG
jgi:MerR family transcriptional regulator, thiopeptide resistance regulator